MRIRYSVAPCRQSRLSAGAHSCRGGTFSDFPISVRRGASTLRPTASRRDDRRASTRRSFQKACVAPAPRRAGKGEYIDTSVWSRSLSEAVGRKKEGEKRRSVSRPGQAIVSVVCVWRRRGARPVFRPDFSPAGRIKPRRFGAGFGADSGQAAANHRRRVGWKFVPRIELCRPDLCFHSGIPLSSPMMQTNTSDKRVG